MNEFSIRSGESEESYIYRVCSNKDKIGNWNDVASIINENIGRNYSESKYRKQYQTYEKMSSSFSSNEELDVLKNARDELYKERIRFYDQRREYNKILAYESRYENLINTIKECATRINNSFPLIEEMENSSYTNESEAILVISDVHYGMKYDGIWNKYNTEICKQRFSEMIKKTKKYIERHKPNTLNIVILGDMAHGSIHVGCRVDSDEDTCDQLMNISEILAETIYSLSKDVNLVNVYCTYGNHMRTIQNKKESIHRDNMEKIIPWWLSTRFYNSNKVRIYESENEFLIFNVCGKNIICSHGDLENFKQFGVTANSLISKKYGITIDYTISGDKHHLEEFEQYGIESILVPSMCGTDSFANDKRLYSMPGQTFMIFNKEDGRECTYNIRFSV